MQLTFTDVVVRVEMLDGRKWTTIVHPSQPWVEIAASQSWLGVVGTYIVQGIRHILFGADHMLFVLGLLLIVKDRPLAFRTMSLYGECMSRLISTTIRLDPEDVRALKRARAAGHSGSELIRKGLRVVASRYYSGRRPPSTRLFESTDMKLGDESQLFRDLEG